MSKKQKAKFEDDGRTIAPMDVEGMPWHFRRGAKKKEAPLIEPEELTKEGSRSLLFGVIAATLLIGAVFAGAFLLFILFCVNVWFK